MITLRHAGPDDLELLQRWGEQPHVIASGGGDDWEFETELGRVVPWREQLIAEHDGRPIGFMQIIDPRDEESHYWGEIERGLRAIDIWIGEPDALGRGFGTEMMRQAFVRCFAPPDVTAVLIDPLAKNTRAIRFYERLGFVAEGIRHFGDDECLVMRLSRERWHRS